MLNFKTTCNTLCVKPQEKTNMDESIVYKKILLTRNVKVFFKTKGGLKG